MKIKLGVRGSTDAVNAIIIKMDDLTLVTGDNIFLIGEENRSKMGENLIKLLEVLIDIGVFPVYASSNRILDLALIIGFVSSKLSLPAIYKSLS